MYRHMTSVVNELLAEHGLIGGNIPMVPRLHSSLSLYIVIYSHYWVLTIGADYIRDTGSTRPWLTTRPSHTTLHQMYPR